MGSKNFSGYIFNDHVTSYWWIVTTGVEQFNHFVVSCCHLVQKRKGTKRSNAKSSGSCRKLPRWYFSLKQQLQKRKCHKIWREIMCNVQNMLHSSLPLKNLASSHHKVAANMSFLSSGSEKIYVWCVLTTHTYANTDEQRHTQCT